jgi:hypothetical protein
MWLYLLGGALVVVGVVGGILTGGIFMIAMIPIGAVIFLSAAGYAAMGRSAERRAGGGDSHASTARPLPHSMPNQSAHTTTSPDALADARRTQQ